MTQKEFVYVMLVVLVVAMDFLLLMIWWVQSEFRGLSISQEKWKSMERIVVTVVVLYVNWMIWQVFRAAWGRGLVP